MKNECRSHATASNALTINTRLKCRLRKSAATPPGALSSATGRGPGSFRRFHDKIPTGISGSSASNANVPAKPAWSIVSGLMIDNASFAGTFALLALLPLIPVAVLSWDLLRLPGARLAAADSAPGGIAVLFRNRHLRRVFIVNALLAVAWDLHSFFIPIYGATIGLSASRIGVILAAFAAATFIVRLFMGWIARRFSEFEVLAAALFVAATAYALFPFVTEVGPLIALSFALGLALGCAQPMVMSLLHNIAPAGRMGEAVGVRMSIINASTFAMPLLFGAVGSTLGLAPVFWSIGAALAGGGFFARRR